MTTKKKSLAKWEREFIKAMKEFGSSEVKEIDAEIKEALKETDPNSQVSEVETEQRNKEIMDKVNKLEARIEYTEEQKKLIKYQPVIRELDKKIKDKEEILENAENKEEIQSEIDKLKEEKDKLEKEKEPYEVIIGGLQRQIRTLHNRLERSVFSGFGSIIKARREELGLSLKDVEAETGISSSYINRIEKGQRKAPSYRIIEQLAKALDLPVSKLVNVAEERIKEDVPSLEELLLTSQFTVNGIRASKKSKEKMVEFIKKLQDSSWSSEKKYEEFITFMSYFDYFKETFSSKK